MNFFRSSLFIFVFFAHFSSLNANILDAVKNIEIMLGRPKIHKKNLPRTIDIDIKEDGIVIFPSKTKHSTQPNFIDNPRISISGDVCIMLKDSFGHERLMPHYNNWQPL